MEYKANCSEKMTERIEEVSEVFAAVSYMACPQPIMDMEEESEDGKEEEREEEKEEQEDKEEESGCNWEKCFKPIVPVLKSPQPKCMWVKIQLQSITKMLYHIFSV